MELTLDRSLVAAVKDIEAPTIFGDLREERRFEQHPFVRRAPAFRYFAAYPLKDRFEHPIGFLSAYDNDKRDVSQRMDKRDVSQRMHDTFNDLGLLVQREIFVTDVSHLQRQLVTKLDATRRQSLLDELTRLMISADS